MNGLLQLGGQPVVYRLGWTLLHFLWQGAAIAGLFAVAHLCLRKSSSNARYLTGCLALLLMLAAPLLTFIALGAERRVPVARSAIGTRSNPASPLVPAVQELPDHVLVSSVPNLNRNVSSNPSPLPFAPALNSEKLIAGLVLAWLLGVSSLSIRLSFSSLQVARLKRRGNAPVGAPWITQLQRLKTALQISWPVRLVKSVLVDVPTVVGWLRPVILLPAATLTGLTPAQLACILAHELAHIRRHDYLVNLLQNALETLLFYHPAVWWVSSGVRAEREICCDEIAINVCGDRLVYAQALATLEQMRGGRSSLALSANGGSLLERIRRLSGAPGGGSIPGRRRAGGAVVAALVAIIFNSLLHHPSSNAKAQEMAPPATNPAKAGPVPVNASKPAENPSGITLQIRCTNEALNVADEIPVQFIISNRGTNDYEYDDRAPEWSGLMSGFKLVSKTSSGEKLPDPHLHKKQESGDFFYKPALPLIVLHPGESFSRTIPLNRWALIKGPGRYETVGTYSSGRGFAVSDPISITVSPRTNKEMDDYIEGLTNQVAARLSHPPSGPIQEEWDLPGALEMDSLILRGKRTERQGDSPRLPRWRWKGLLRESVIKMMYTCSPKIVPALLSTMNDLAPRNASEFDWDEEALLYYVPHTEEVRKEILQWVAEQGLIGRNAGLLMDYGFKHEDLTPIIERALAADNIDAWYDGAWLAAFCCYDNAFSPRLAAIATATNSPGLARGMAIEALAWNRTDAGVQALRKLLKEPDHGIWEPLVNGFSGGYNNEMVSATGRHLQKEDFDAGDLRPFVDRLLASSNSKDVNLGVNLLIWFGDDAETPKLVALATSGELGFSPMFASMYALAMNRTDEGVKTLKRLLNSPDPRIAMWTEKAIRRAYTSRGNARGRPLRADDFEAKFREPEQKPAK